MSAHLKRQLARAEQHWARCRAERQRFERCMDTDSEGQLAALARLLYDERRALDDCELIERTLTESVRCREPEVRA